MDHPSTIQLSGTVARNTEQKGQKVAVHCAPPIDLDKSRSMRTENIVQP